MTVKFSFATLEQPFEADWPVKVAVPLDGGGVEEQVFMARFRIELATSDEAEASPTPQAEATDAPKDFPFMVGLGKGEGELTDAMRAAMAARGYVRLAIYRAWQEFQHGVVPKN
ncbi:hypothetical protein [Phenylobacterium sp.]|uniref:hypothetical protein n=1 Tax=Phenylobacterium sp. TaxID=1871053 RepID=UPI0035B40ECD